MLVKCAYFRKFQNDLGWPDIKFTSCFNQKHGWLLHKVERGGGGHLPQMPHPGSAIDGHRNRGQGPPSLWPWIDRTGQGPSMQFTAGVIFTVMHHLTRNN